MRRTPPTRALVLAAMVLCANVLTGCGNDELMAKAEREGTKVGDAVKAQSEESGSDITTAISEDPWKGESDAYVTGTYDYLVNVRDGACAKVVFEADDSGSDYTIEETYEFGEVGDDVQ